MTTNATITAPWSLPPVPVAKVRSGLAQVLAGLALVALALVAGWLGAATALTPVPENCELESPQEGTTWGEVVHCDGGAGSLLWVGVVFDAAAVAAGCLLIRRVPGTVFSLALTMIALTFICVGAVWCLTAMGESFNVSV